MGERGGRGVILDVDGTLVDSNDAHARAWVRALKEAGFDVPFARVRPLIGMGGDKLLPEVTGLEEDDPRAKRIGERRGEIFKKEYLPTLRAFPKTRELLLRMREEGLRLAVASSAKPDELQPLLELAGAADLIEGASSADEAESSKPDPDVVHAALDRLHMDPAEVVMIGDTPYDVEAASRAGARAIAFRCGGWHDDRLKGAVAIYDGPADLLARFAESPLAAVTPRPRPGTA